MKIISYWKDEMGNEPTPFYVNDEADASYIVGFYSHKGAKPMRAMGVYYRRDFPYVKNGDYTILSPLVLPYDEAVLLLEGLLKSLIEKKESDKIVKVADALAFLLR